MKYCNRRLLDFHSEHGESMVMFYLEGTTFLNGLISKHKAFEHLLCSRFLTQSQKPSHIARWIPSTINDKVPLSSLRQRVWFNVSQACFIAQTTGEYEPKLLFLPCHSSLWYYDGFFKERACQVVLVVKNPPASAGDTRDLSSIPGSRRSPGERNGNPLQYSRLENPMDREAWWATVDVAAKSRTWLSTQTKHNLQRKFGFRFPDEPCMPNSLTA